MPEYYCKSAERNINQVFKISKRNFEAADIPEMLQNGMMRIDFEIEHPGKYEQFINDLKDSHKFKIFRSEYTI